MLQQPKNKLSYTISGKFVICSTFVTFTPAASRLDAVPPVEMIENLQGAKIFIRPYITRASGKAIYVMNQHCLK